MMPLILRLSVVLASFLAVVFIFFLTSKESRLEDTLPDSMLERGQILAERDTSIRQSRQP